MSTRSRIGLLNADGTITSIYCHSDGYPDGVGQTLFDHYQDKEKVAALIALGDISCIGEEIGEKHDFEWRGKEYFSKGNYGYEQDPRYKMVRAYGRDRGETGVDPTTSDSVDAFLEAADNSGGVYAYLFQNGIWMICEDPGPGKNLSSLERVLKAPPEEEGAKD